MSYAAAKRVCTEADMQRFACIALNSDLSNVSLPSIVVTYSRSISADDAVQINWDKAAADYGSKSADSMRTMVNSALRKTRAEEAKAGTGEGDVQPNSATTKAKKSSPKKRKNDEADGGAVKKAPGKKAQSAKTSQGWFSVP